MVDYSFSFDVMQYNYDRWLFKPITGTVNSCKGGGCSPNQSLVNTVFSRTFWQHQHLCLIDAVRQFGFPWFFVTISRYGWTFPFPPFIEHVRDHYAKDVTDLPMLETIHIAHILEQIARGYLTGGSSNRWKTHIGNSQQPSQKNILTYFYRFEFQQRGTLHLHMLAWVDISATRADVLHASVPWNNADGAFLVASTQKSDKSCLPVNHHLDSFTTDTLGNTISSYKRRRRQAHTGLHNHSPGVPAVPHWRPISRWQGPPSKTCELVCDQDSQVCQLRGSVLHWCHWVSGGQLFSAHSEAFGTRDDLPINKHKSLLDRQNDCFVLSPFPRPSRQQQGVPNVAEADNTLLQWLRSDRTSGPKPKVYDDNKVLVRVKFVSIFNPIHFYKHLTMHYSHQSPNQLHHAEEESMPPSIKFFAKAIAFTPDDWATAESLSLDALSYSFTRHLCQFLLHGSPFGFQRSLAIRHHYVGTA